MLKLSNIRIPVRIAVACLLPLVAFTAFAVHELLDKRAVFVDMGAIGVVAEAAPMIAGVVHELQRERGASVGYIDSREQSLADAMRKQRPADRQGARCLESAPSRVCKILSWNEVREQPRYRQAATGRTCKDARGYRCKLHRQPEGDAGHGVHGRGPSQRCRCDRRYDGEWTDHPSSQGDGRADAAQGIYGARSRLGHDRLRSRSIRPADVSGVHAQPEPR